MNARLRARFVLTRGVPGAKNATMSEQVAPLPELGGALAVSLVSLGLVCLLAYVALKWLARRGIGRSGDMIRVVARCPLEPRRSVYVIEATGRFFLVGVGDGPMSLLAELDREGVASVQTGTAPGDGTMSGDAADGGRGFAGVLARVLKGRGPGDQKAS